MQTVHVWFRAVLDWLGGDRAVYSALRRWKSTPARGARRELGRAWRIISAELSLIIAPAPGTALLCFAFLDEHRSFAGADGSRRGRGIEPSVFEDEHVDA